MGSEMCIRDSVRIEIAAALARNIRVIPVTIDSARLPKAGELPDPLKPLIRRQAVEVRNAQFRRDADALVEKLHRALGSDRVGPNRQRAPVRFRWSSTRGRITLALAGALLLACSIGFYQLVPGRVGKFDGDWLVLRAGCAGRPVLSFQIHVESGNISGRFEPKELGPLPGSRPSIIGSISAGGEIKFNIVRWRIQAKLPTRTRITREHFVEILLQAHLSLVNATAHSQR